MWNLLRNLAYASVLVAALTFTAHNLIHPAHAQTSGGFVASEVAVLSGTLQDGGQIPLPVYSDGTVAMQADCHWIVSGDGWTVSNGWYINCFTLPDRTVRAYATLYGGSIRPAQANYLIIATRPASGPTASETRSWSDIKSRFNGQK